MRSDLLIPNRSLPNTWRRLAIAAVALSAACVGRPLAADVVIVDQGQGRAVVVTAENPTPTASYAARELIAHIERATGVSLPILTEADVLPQNAARIYVGMTAAAVARGIRVEDLELEASLLRASGQEVFVVGREDAQADPLDETSPFSGTLFGVYELLDRFVGVRWLWPGELGTYIPVTDRLVFGSMDEVIQPAIEFRRFRWNAVRTAQRRYQPQIRQLGFSDDGIAAFADATQTYFRRHRMGTRLSPEQYRSHGRVSHSMKNWWLHYGQDHPDLFMMDESGRRGHYEPNSPRVDPCLSNPALHRLVVEKIWDGSDVLRLGAKDHHNSCHCENCLAWDEPRPDDPYMSGRIISNRYARFYKAVYELARQKNPDVEILAYLYMGYFPAPTVDISFNSNIYLEFVPWGQGSTIWFPTEDARLQWLKQQWLGWKRTGAKLGYRPNWELGGYVMPHVNTRQGGDFFKFAFEHGMSMVCLSYLGQFGTRGPEHYMYARLTGKPELSVEQARQEYFAAFGPAARHIEAYFDHWETYNHRLLRQGRWSNMWSSPASSPDQYPPEVFAQAQQMLQRALHVAQSHSRKEFAQRVAFLQTGLEHARLSAQMVVAMRRHINTAEHADEARQALRELIAYRREHEGSFISNYLSAIRIERRQYATYIDRLLSEDAAEADRPRYIEFEAVQVPAFLARTDVGPYVGFGWYRTTFAMPEHLMDKPVSIHFGGVDEQAWVYVNGQLVGEHTVESESRPAEELWDLPFTVNVGREHLVGGENLLVVRMHASDGNAGIHKPVEVRVEGQPLRLTQAWEFRRDPHDRGVTGQWYATMPGEDAFH